MHKISKKSLEHLNELGIDPEYTTTLIVKTKIPFNEASFEVKAVFTEEQYNTLSGTNSFIEIPSINEQINNLIEEKNISSADVKSFAINAMYSKSDKVNLILLNVEWVEEQKITNRFIRFDIDADFRYYVYEIYNNKDFTVALQAAVDYAYSVGLSHGGMDNSLFQKALKCDFDLVKDEVKDEVTEMVVELTK